MKSKVLQHKRKESGKQMRSLKRNLGIAPFLVVLPLHAHGGFADVAHLVIQYLGLVIVTALFCFILSFILMLFRRPGRR
ncbi:MAG: hypothetical protein KF713_15690 [Turneriella sp.]|nr:hypothetical protein [Turneriella sp.]